MNLGREGRRVAIKRKQGSMEMTVRETKAGNSEVHPPGLPWVAGWRLCLLPRPS